MFESEGKMLDTTEIKRIQDIESKYYIQPMLAKIRNDIENKTWKLQDVFNHLYDYTPQHKGMFKFFDCAFIGKDMPTADFIKPLSHLIDYVNENL
ncbi:MAG: hypothetical protein K2N12_05030 [Helicobacter sp.]|nr:hypothetical protein [Helicobacter sp.]